MRGRLPSLSHLLRDVGPNPPLLYAVEASLVGLFFVQALRFLVGTLYARMASASLFPALDPALIDPAMPGLVEPATVSTEISLVLYMMLLPIIAIIAGRFGKLIAVAAIIAAVGRYLLADGSISPIVASSITIGGGLLYTALLVRHRARTLPYMFILALALDQLLRAMGNTLDPSLPGSILAISVPFPLIEMTISMEYVVLQIGLSIIAVVLAVLNIYGQTKEKRKTGEVRSISPDTGLMPVWGGIGFGAILFLEMSLFSLPNAIGGRAETDYTLLVPMVMLATMLPLVPWIRGQARQYIGMFDSSVRGWAWMLGIMLMVVFGTRISGIFAAATLVLAQFAISMVWWWLLRPQAQKERNLSGLWVILGMLVFALLLVFDTFTYEYAFVRDFAQELDFLNPIIPPLMRGFRGMGLAIILLSVFLAVLPMAQTRRRIAWVGGGFMKSAIAAIFVIVMSMWASFAARPPIVKGAINTEQIRVGTYNIHAGFNEFYDYNIEDLAINIQYSGANVVLLQEIEAGRMTSFGVDQPLWLARHLGMDVRFYPTNEGLQGLAILSNIEIVYDDGVILDSIGHQTGLQRVQILPDEQVITIYNTWLDPLLDTGETTNTTELEQDQENQLFQIFGIINTHNPDGLGRMIIGGTFNNIPDSDLIRQMPINGFTDHFVGEQLERAATFMRTGQLARLDYLWTTNVSKFYVAGADVIDPISGNILESNPSDHRLAIILLDLR